jgi:UDP-N-acetylglucosamine:LPS N-acetylglucosamine transferase
MDPNWKPWQRNKNTAHDYPRMFKIEEKPCTNGGKSLYEIYHSCCGIISKPGGNTLMDSLITATPIVFLEPIAEHEKVNEMVWTKFGFGLSYETWMQSGDLMETLEGMKEKIVICRSNKPYLGARLVEELR